jgi:hypothetical protein
MRTTIDVSSGHRAALLRIAAERGEKGFSSIVAEALDAYLASAGRIEDRAGALRLKGVLADSDPAELRKRVAAVHESWR